MVCFFLRHELGNDSKENYFNEIILKKILKYCLCKLPS